MNTVPFQFNLNIYLSTLTTFAKKINKKWHLNKGFAQSEEKRKEFKLSLSPSDLQKTESVFTIKSCN